jgi:NADH:ubiquinone oxidoreductase subunit F (NADH-binding)
MTVAADRQTSGRLLAGVGGPPTLEAHVATFGRVSLPDGFVELVERAALRGRGGAAFPTAAKLAVVAGARGRRPVVVANGAEGEPASKKDRSLLRVAPHLVLDGVELAAATVGAREAVIAVSRAAPELEHAVGERRSRLALDVRFVPETFVSGEETALLKALAGRPAKPALKPPYPFERGLDGRPTLVQNVETLAHLALVARFGPDWFAGGTCLLTLGGAVRRPGVHEVPLGTTLATAIDSCGGTAGEVSGYLVGGYFGSWVDPAEAATLRLTPERVGAGAIVALPAAACAVAEVGRVTRYLAGESAGQCGPCVHGLAAAAGALDPSRGDRRRDALRFAQLAAGRGACRHPDGVARFLESALRVFERDFGRHAEGRRCGGSDLKVLPVG